MNIGQKILSLRKKAKLTGNELAKLSKVSQSTISDIEKEKRSPQLDTLEKICTALNVNLIDILPDEIRLAQSVAQDEIELLEIYRSLTTKEKQALILLLKRLKE